MRSLLAGRPRQLQVARLLPRRLLLLLVLRDPPSFHFISDRRRRRRGTSNPAVSLDAAEFLVLGPGRIEGVSRERPVRKVHRGWGGVGGRGMHPVGAEPAFFWMARSP